MVLLDKLLKKLRSEGRKVINMKYAYLFLVSSFPLPSNHTACRGGGLSSPHHKLSLSSLLPPSVSHTNPSLEKRDTKPHTRT